MATAQAAQRRQNEPQQQRPPQKRDGTPPHDQDAEKSMLGSLLLAAYKLDDVLLVISAQDLYFPRHQKIFQAMLDLQKSHTPVDVLTVASKLQAGGQLTECGGPEYLTALMESVPHAGHTGFYAKIIAEKAVRRSLILAGQDAIASAHDETSLVDEVVGKSESKICAVVERLAGKKQVNVNDILADLMSRLDGQNQKGVMSGFSDLDALTRGFQPQNLIILAARPSAGKTALCVNVLEHVARSGKPVGIISLEQSAGELCERLICGTARISMNLLREPSKLTEAQRDSIMQAAAEISQLPVVYDDQPHSIVTLEAQARVMKRRDRIEMLIIDYLQIIAPENRRDPREQQVADISRRLKRLAKTLDIPVICLAQLNRQIEKETDPRPKLSHLRESGSIEQDADLVMFLHRPEQFKPGDRPGEAELYLAKQRNGPTGKIDLVFDHEQMKFRNSAGSSAALREPAEFGGRSDADSWQNRYMGSRDI